MKKPRIGLSGSHIIDTAGVCPGYRRAFVNHDYVQSVINAGGTPIMLPFTDDEEVAKDMIAAVDGLLLTGGHDVYPLHYGEEPLQGIEDVWPERDRFDFALLEEAQRRRLPIMGICRGHQIINVYHGGSLYQDLKYDDRYTLKHSQDQRPDLATHTVTLEGDSHLARLLSTTSIVTNSFHHQTVRRVGEGLRVTGLAKDGTVEAMEGTEYPYLMTYQFHPEMMTATADFAKRIFEDFIQAARQ